jgi:hypothetical protein
MDDMGPSSPTEGKLREATSRRGPIAIGFNHHEHEFAGLVKAHQSWVMAIFDDEKLDGAPILTEDMADDTLNAVRFFFPMWCSVPSRPLWRGFTTSIRRNWLPWSTRRLSVPDILQGIAMPHRCWAMDSLL